MIYLVRKEMNKMNTKFFICENCGNIIEMIVDSGVNPYCCGTPMTELVPNTKEAATEKHIPVIDISDNHVVVTVGSVMHPMTPEHYIMWIMVETNTRKIKFDLTLNNEPKIEMDLEPNEEIKNVYAYCNLHSLWMKEI